MNIKVNLTREQAIEFARVEPQLVVTALCDEIDSLSSEKNGIGVAPNDSMVKRIVDMLVRGFSNPEQNKIQLIKYTRSIAMELTPGGQYTVLVGAKNLVEEIIRIRGAQIPF